MPEFFYFGINLDLQKSFKDNSEGCHTSLAQFQFPLNGTVLHYQGTLVKTKKLAQHSIN